MTIYSKGSHFISSNFIKLKNNLKLLDVQPRINNVQGNPKSIKYFPPYVKFYPNLSECFEPIS